MHARRYRYITMQRTTIMLPPELKIEAQNCANELGISVGKLIRDSLKDRIEKNKQGKEVDLLFSRFPTFESDSPKDLSTHHDEYLYGTKR